MNLLSLEFFLFFSLVLLLYNISPQKARWVILLIGSLFFYCFAGIFAFIYIIFMTLSSYIFALAVQKYQKEGSRFAISTSLALGVIFILFFWAALKLKNSVGGILLPLGISFYSLRIISYLIDVKRKKTRAERNFFKYLLFVTYFPLMIIGPFAKYSEISDALYMGRRARGEELLSGLIRLLWGVFKKLVIANTLSVPLSLIARDAEKYSGVYVIFLLVFYSAQIYADFSSGIDVLLGASSMLGISLPENFDRPFSSVSLREFWNRWHITLGEWFERYVFFPLSLSKPMQKLSKRGRRRFGVKAGRKIPVYLATMVTWFLTGLWHGARTSFIAWGLINGALVLVSQETAPLAERFYRRYPSIKSRKALLVAIGRIRVFLVIGAVRLLDVYGDVALTFKMLLTPFSDFESYGSFISGGLFSLIAPPVFVTVIASLVLFFVVSERKIKASDIAKSPILSAASVFSLVLLSLLLGRYGEGFFAGDFIYSQF